MKFDWLEKKNFKLHFQFRFVWERERESVSPPLLGKSRCVLCVCVCVCLFWKSTARCNNNFPFSLSRHILQKISTQVGLFSSLLKRWRGENKVVQLPRVERKNKIFSFSQMNLLGNVYWRGNCDANQIRRKQEKKEKCFSSYVCPRNMENNWRSWTLSPPSSHVKKMERRI